MIRTNESELDPDLLKRLGRLDVIAAVLANAVKQGLRRSRRHGFSPEFSDYKAYAPGDDPRFLDWRIYARTGRLLTRKYQAETSFESLLVLDASRSMAWRWKARISKLEYATQLFAAIAYLHIAAQDQVGLLVHDAHEIHFLPPRSTRSQLTRIFEVLSRARPGSADTFAALVQSLPALKKYHGQIVVCSDLEENEEEVDVALEALAAREDDVVVLHLLDHAEIELPFDACTHFEDSETGDSLPIDLDVLKKTQGRAVEEISRDWRLRCESRGIRFFAVHTRMAYVDVLMDLAAR